MHKSATKEPEWKIEFSLSGSILLHIPALCPTTPSDIYYGAKGEIFFFVYFTSSSLLSNYSTVTVPESVDCFCASNMLSELLFLEQYWHPVETQNNYRWVKIPKEIAQNGCLVWDRYLIIQQQRISFPYTHNWNRIKETIA